MDDVIVSRFERICCMMDGSGRGWTDRSQSEYQAAKGPCSNQAKSHHSLGSKAGCCHPTIQC